jgi:hypothetical protein
MADTTDSLILEILRQLRGDMTAMRSEMREGLNRLDVRMGLIEQALGGMLSVSPSDRDEIRSLRQRVERIERRLEL